MLIPALLYVVATALVLAAEFKLELISEDTPAQWMVDHIFVPAMRIAAVVFFVALAHPQIYGLEATPTIGTILFQHGDRFETVVNIVFVASLFLPLIPLLGRQESIILPLQAMIAATVIFHWTASGMGIQVSLWPGWELLARVLALAIAGDLVGRFFRDRVLRGEVGPVRLVAFDASVLLFQLPAVWVWCRALGDQLR